MAALAGDSRRVWVERGVSNSWSLYLLAMGIVARKDNVTLVTLCVCTCPELCNDSVAGLGREPSASDPLWKCV